MYFAARYHRRLIAKGTFGSQQFRGLVHFCHLTQICGGCVQIGNAGAGLSPGVPNECLKTCLTNACQIARSTPVYPVSGFPPFTIPTARLQTALLLSHTHTNVYTQFPPKTAAPHSFTGTVGQIRIHRGEQRPAVAVKTAALVATMRLPRRTSNGNQCLNEQAIA